MIITPKHTLTHFEVNNPIEIHKMNELQRMIRIHKGANKDQYKQTP